MKACGKDASSGTSTKVGHGLVLESLPQHISPGTIETYMEVYTTFVGEVEGSGGTLQVHRSTPAETDTLRDFSIGNIVDKHRATIRGLPSLMVRFGSAIDSRVANPDDFFRNVVRDQEGVLTIYDGTPEGKTVSLKGIESIPEDFRGLSNICEELAAEECKVVKARDGAVKQARFTVLHADAFDHNPYQGPFLASYLHTDVNIVSNPRRRRAIASTVIGSDGNIVQSDRYATHQIIGDIVVPVGSGYGSSGSDEIAVEHVRNGSAVALLSKNGSLSFAPTLRRDGHPWQPPLDVVSVLPRHRFAELTDTTMHFRPKLSEGVVRLAADTMYIV